MRAKGGLISESFPNHDPEDHPPKGQYTSEAKNYFVRFLVQMRTRKFASEIY